MINEGPHEFGYFIELICDTKRRGHTHTSAYIATSTRNQCNTFLHQMGWRLYRGKQMCAECVERILLRMEKRRAMEGKG